MKTKWLAWINPAAAKTAAATSREARTATLESDGPGRPSPKENSFTSANISASSTADNANYYGLSIARAARRRFLAEHGPGAEAGARRTQSKETRKAVLAAEMARWERY